MIESRMLEAGLPGFRTITFGDTSGEYGVTLDCITIGEKGQVFQ